MDKSWMTLGRTTNGRISPQYFEGVDSFINFAKAVVDENGNILCPCLNCANIYRQTLGIVQVHLVQRGIMQTYIKWYEHGEPRVSNNTHCNEMSDTDCTSGIEQWIGLIDGNRSNEDWLKRSKKNSDNRKKSKEKHRCGAKSIPVRVDEHRQKNGGQLLEFSMIYRETRYNPKKNEWVAPECEERYEEIIRVQEEHLSDPNTIPLTPEEVSIRVLKPRSGYVKGLGMRPSFSIKTMSSSTSNAYVRRLEECIVELQEANRRQEEERKKEMEEREKEKEDRIKYENATFSIIEFLRGKGFTGAEPFGNGGSSSSG